MLAKLQYQLNDAHRIGLTVEYFNADLQSDLLSVNAYNDYSAFFGPGNFLEYADTHVKDETKRTRLGIQHQWRADNAAFDTLNWQLDYQESTTLHKTFDNINMSPTVELLFGLDNGPRLKDYSHEEESLQFSALFNKAMQNHLLIYGLSYESNEITNETNTIYLDNSSPSEHGRYVPLVEGEGKDEDGNDYPLDEISPLKAIIGLAYDAPSARWGIALNLTLVKNKKSGDLADASNAVTPGYGVVDMLGYFNITPQLQLNAGVYNLNNKNYSFREDVRGSGGGTNLDRFSQPGRYYNLSLKYSL